MLLKIFAKRESQHCLATAWMPRQPQESIAAFFKETYKHVVAANPLACAWKRLCLVIIVLVHAAVLVE
jgi:hypothetical protein